MTLTTEEITEGPLVIIRQVRFTLPQWELLNEVAELVDLTPGSLIRNIVVCWAMGRLQDDGAHLDVDALVGELEAMEQRWNWA